MRKAIRRVLCWVGLHYELRLRPGPYGSVYCPDCGQDRWR